MTMNNYNIGESVKVPNLEKFVHTLSNRLSKEECGRIERVARNKYLQLMRECDFPTEKALRFHIEHQIFPGISLYEGILSLGFEKEKALSFVNTSFEAWAIKPQKVMRFFSFFPFYYEMIRVSVKKIIDVGFPSSGWDVEMIENSKREISFNMKSCFYHKTLKAYDVPELTSLYCNSDVVMFSGASRCITFQRSKTIAKGDEICNFQFIKRVYTK